MSRRSMIAAAIAAITAAAGSWALATRPDGRLHVTVLNTGSAPSVLVRTGDGSTVLVDGGAAPSLLLGALGRVLAPFTAHLDMVVITGGEQAAVQGLAGLPGHYGVGTVVSPGGLNPGGDDAVALLEQAGADVLDAGGGGWSFGGDAWRCLPFFALAGGRSMCVLTVADVTGRALILGDAGAADQEDLCAVYGGSLAADLVVTPPGGAVAAALLATVHPREFAVPIAAGAASTPAPSGYATDRTSSDGDLEYVGGATGLMKAQ